MVYSWLLLRISNWREMGGEDSVFMTLSVTLSKTPIFTISSDISVPVSSGLTLISFLESQSSQIRASCLCVTYLLVGAETVQVLQPLCRLPRPVMWGRAWCRGYDPVLLCSALAPVATIIPPPPDIQPVIDKLAEYVARNGLKFETSVRAKNDQR